LQNTKDNPPCNTLFIGNLGETVVEEELRSLFSVQPGYKQMKVLRQERNTVCFIEFEVTSYTMTMMLFYFQASWSMLEMSSSEATKQLK